MIYNLLTIILKALLLPLFFHYLCLMSYLNNGIDQITVDLTQNKGCEIVNKSPSFSLSHTHTEKEQYSFLY